MMTIADKEEQIINEFTLFDDWMDKYNYIIDLGKSLPMIDEKLKTESNLIKGCQSRVWLSAEFDGKVINFTGDSDAVITKGIANLLVRTLSGHTPDEILDADMGFVDKIGLKEHLSPTRSNGLVSMIKQMKLYALAYKTKASLNA
jgi:cysteine desulfuration protein SufE